MLGTPARARGRASGAQTLAPAEVDLANPSRRGDGARGVVAARGCRAVAWGCGEGAPASGEVREAAGGGGEAVRRGRRRRRGCRAVARGCGEAA